MQKYTLYDINIKKQVPRLGYLRVHFNNLRFEELGVAGLERRRDAILVVYTVMTAYSHGTQ